MEPCSRGGGGRFPIETAADTQRDHDEDELWRALKLDPSGEARRRLFEIHLPYSRSIALRIRRERKGGDLDPGDLTQSAALGLLQAIDRFDADRGVPFRAFAARRIAGAVVDGISESSDLRRRASLRNRVRMERARSLAEETPETLSPGDALQALADLATELALGFMMEMGVDIMDGEPVTRERNAYESLAWGETMKHMVQAVQNLPEQESTVIRWHYLEGLEFVRIAEVLGLSRGRVSQIHASALRRMRKLMPRSASFHFRE